jgi:predicted GNAT family acetyltransferase
MTEIKLKLNDNKKGMFNLYENEERIGEMVISISNAELTVYHTEIADHFEGKGYAKLLLDAMIAYVREHNYKVIPLCPYVFAQFKKHPDEYADIWKKE